MSSSIQYRPSQAKPSQPNPTQSDQIKSEIWPKEKGCFFFFLFFWLLFDGLVELNAEWVSLLYNGKKASRVVEEEPEKEEEEEEEEEKDTSQVELVPMRLELEDTSVCASISIRSVPLVSRPIIPSEKPEEEEDDDEEDEEEEEEIKSPTLFRWGEKIKKHGLSSSSSASCSGVEG